MLSYYYLTNNQVSKISKYAFQLPFNTLVKYTVKQVYIYILVSVVLLVYYLYN